MPLENAGQLAANQNIRAAPIERGVGGGVSGFVVDIAKIHAITTSHDVEYVKIPVALYHSPRPWRDQNRADVSREERKAWPSSYLE